MTQFTVNSQSISSQSCQFIAPFNNGYFIIAGLSTQDYSPCLKYSTVFPLYRLNVGWHETQFLSMYDSTTQQVLGNGVDAALPGQICAPPIYFYDPYLFSLYNASKFKLAPLDASVCNNSEVCSIPLDAEYAIFNTSTQMAVDIDTIICNSSEICSLPEEALNSTLSGENSCEQYGTSFYLGIATGVAGTLFLMAMGACAYYAKNSLHKSHHVIPDHEVTELTPTTSHVET